MIGMTICSGIGAPEVAAPWVDWRLASEIEPFPRAVLQHRLGYKAPADHNQGEPLLWGDMREVTPDLLRRHGIPLPNIVVAGTPCQAFSVAGARKGLEDPRGNLTLAFVDLLHAIVAARPDGKLAVLWENVPGVLSDSGNAFGCFLGGLVGSLDAIPAPAGGSWPREGMVEGPRSRAAWAVLDAQWFGVAQRRERVFVVVDFGGAIDPAAVLLEPDSLRGDTPPRREAGQGAARGFECGPQGGSFTDLAPTLDTRCKDGPIRNQLGAGVMCAEIAPTLGASFHDKQGLDNQHINGGGDCSLPPVAMCLKAHGVRLDAESETLLPVTGGGFDVAHTLRGEGFDASEDGTGRGTPLVPVAVAMRGREDGAQIEVGDDCAFTLRASTGGFDKPHVFAPVAFDCKGTEVQFQTDGGHPPLRSMGHLESHQNAGGHAAVAIFKALLSDGDNVTNSHAGKEKTDPVEILRRVRRALGEKAFAEWGLGVSDTLQPAQVLRPEVHGSSVRPARKAEPRMGNGSSAREEDSPAGAMSEMRSAGRARRAPSGSQLSEQLAGELGAYLSELPYQGASDENCLRDLWRASEGLGILREALSEIQEAWRPDEGDRASTCSVPGVRRTCALEGPVREALHAGEEGRNPHLTDRSGDASGKGGDGVWAVRRLTPRLRECARLQAFPDDWTQIPWRGKPAELCPDGPQYKALGNSMAVVVVKYIMDRMRISMMQHGATQWGRYALAQIERTK